METQTQQQEGGDQINNNNNNRRWAPTTEQIRILKDLYYNNGLRSPSTEQIQRITARLRQYGKIEGKNVFYWFQNHKARERQKMRLASTTTTNTIDHDDLQVPPMSSMQQKPSSDYNAAPSWKPQDSLHKYHITTSSSSPAGVNYEYGSVPMDKIVRDIETLPLFPLHGEEHNIKQNPNSNSSYYSSWYGGSSSGSSRVSLELSLKTRSSDSM